MDPRAPGVWRPKRDAILDFLRRHSATTAQVAERFFGGCTLACRKLASRWLVKQRKRGRVRVLGVVTRRDTGRPELVYGRRCKQKEIEHEVRVADIEILLGVRIERDAKVGGTEADGVFARRGEPCYLEVDNSGKATPKQMRTKWEKYAGAEGFIFVAATSERRMHRLREGAALVADRAFFSTFDRMRSGRPWLDVEGNEVDF